MDDLEARFWFAVIRDDQVELEKVRRLVLLRRSESLASVCLGAKKKTFKRPQTPAYA